MKKAALPFLLCACLAPAFSQNLAGLDQWVLGFPAGKTDLAGRKITECVIERTGALVVLDRQGKPLRLSLLKPLPLEALAARLGALERAVLDPKALAGEGWSVAAEECEVDFGLKDEMTVALRLSSFRFRLNAETTLDLAGRLEADPVFRTQANTGRFSYTLRFRGIDPGTGAGDIFPGWGECVRRIIAWFQKGILAADQDTLAIVLDAKVDAAAKRIPGPIERLAENRTNLWIGMNIDYLMSNLLSSEPAGVAFNPAGYNLLAPMAYLSWRNLGDPSWLAKPYRITLELGGFLEFNARSLMKPSALEYLNFAGGPGSFLFAGGPAIGVEFSAMIPRIVNDKYTGDLFGVGIELFTVFNLPYFFPDYYYEYFLNQYVNIIFHMLPVESRSGAAGGGAGFNLILGFNAAFGTLDYAETGAIIISRYSFSVGARFKIDFANFMAADGAQK